LHRVVRKHGQKLSQETEIDEHKIILNALLRLVAGDTSQHVVALARASSHPDQAFNLKNILGLEDHSFILNHSNYESASK
jgi:hypothetical protein